MKVGLKEGKCTFCNLKNNENFLLENDFAFAIKDTFPVTEGHTLIVSKRHVSDYFELDFEEQVGLIKLLNEVHSKIKIDKGIDSFNIGINVNDEAGQTIPHVHVHLIPRSAGDVDNPRGGVRNIIPGKGDY